MFRSTADELRALTAAIFRAAGAQHDDAELVAASLLDAELCGHQSHGLIRVPEYLRQIREGLIVPDAQPRIVKDGAATLVVDGSWGFGQLVARRATDWVCERAHQHGVAAVGIHRCGHVGRVGSYPQLAADQGLVALAFVNGGGAEPRVAPHGGSRPLFGTNPLAAAVPIPDAAPVVVDFSTAVVASGKIRVLRDRGEPLPEGWVLDSEGRPTTRAEDYYDGGMLLPAAEHKGYGLCLLIELLAGCLTGAGSVALPESGYRLGNGMFLQAVDPGAFVGVERFGALASALAEAVAGTPPASGYERVMLPGEPERARAREAAERGIEISDGLWRALGDAAAELGVEA
ncbi:MAG: Ldh family oxidoreductase [Solirubrobacterales bacterium]|nr:Ldh family oxidoreductase [Solirubrobacterales bacterium]MBV9472719.1 Ldh family oxidoreductase [Solirubrobacterales bacterium]